MELLAVLPRPLRYARSPALCCTPGQVTPSGQVLGAGATLLVITGLGNLPWLEACFWGFLFMAQ